MNTILTEARLAGNPAEPLVRALRRVVPEEAAQYIHLGATSQDILDTAGMLIARRALSLIEADIARLAGGCAHLAQTHRDTLMAGRTLLQQATPITFGLKAAGWLSGLTRTWRGLRRLHEDCLAVELGGAAGTLAPLDETGPAVLRELAALLGLAEPALPWHTDRTRPAEIGAALAIAAGATDKIALDIILLAQTEVGEVMEGGEGRGRSSTMPHKRNPVGAVLARACAQQAAASAEVLLRGMAQEHERAAGLWQAEWQALSGTLAYAGGAMAALAEVVEALEVRPERMRHNLVMTGGLLMAERVAQLLAPAVGKGEANDLIRRLSLQADVGFREALLSDRTVRAHLSIKEIDAALDPAGYLGATQAFIDRALAQYRALT